MADPLSVAASIAGLVSLASEVAKACYSCYQFYRTAAKAPESLQQVIAELGLLRKILSHLEGIYMHKTEDLPSVKNVMKEIENCWVAIEDFGQRLDPTSKSHDFRRVAIRLRWPSKEKDVKQFISHLQTYRATFDSAKSNDGLLLAMQTLTIAKETQNNEQSEQSRRHLEEILTWLSPLDFGLRQDEIYSNRRQHGTWILKESAFKRWLDATRDSNKTTLLLKGDPGAGKTVLW
jgi:hypothetical protein